MAYAFSSATSHVVVQNVDVPVNYTISMWFYRIGSGGQTLGRLFASTPAASGTSAQLFYSQTGNNIQFEAPYETTAGKWSANLDSYPANQWHNVVVVSGATGTPVIYLNGASLTVTTVQTPVGAKSVLSARDFYIGNTSALTRYWDGYHAEFAIWGDVLGPAKAVALASGLPATSFKPADLIVYAPLRRELVDVVGGRTVTSGSVSVAASSPPLFGHKQPQLVHPASARRLYVNTSPSNSGRVQVPYTTWSDSQIVAKTFTRNTLGAGPYYLQAVDEYGVQSNWYGPISEASLGPVITAFSPAGPWTVGDVGRKLVGTGFGA